jgi:hypothetical protein
MFLLGQEGGEFFKGRKWPSLETLPDKFLVTLVIFVSPWGETEFYSEQGVLHQHNINKSKIPCACSFIFYCSEYFNLTIYKCICHTDNNISVHNYLLT